MLPRQPLAIAAELDAGAIYEKRHGAVRAAVGDLQPKPSVTPAERGIVRNRPVQPRHLD